MKRSPGVRIGKKTINIRNPKTPRPQGAKAVRT
jgi:hypothetical protein